MGLKVMNVKSDPPFHGGHFGNDVIKQKGLMKRFFFSIEIFSTDPKKAKSVKSRMGIFFRYELIHLELEDLRSEHSI